MDQQSLVELRAVAAASENQGPSLPGFGRERKAAIAFFIMPSSFARWVERGWVAGHRAQAIMIGQS